MLEFKKTYSYSQLNVNTVSHSLSSSIVVITSKGRLVTRGSWTKVLERLGADKSTKLKGN